jgi:hypothetical protein
MERGDCANSLRDKFTLFYDIISKTCRNIKNNDDKIAYLKKIIRDCDKIIELTDLFDEIEFDLGSIKKEFGGIDENFYWLLNDEQAGPSLKKSYLVGEPQATYMSFELDKLSKDNPNFIIDGIKKIKMHLEFDSERMLMDKNEIDNDDIERIKILSSMSDVVRILEAKKKAGIISTKTEVKQIAKMFHTETADSFLFEKKYNATKNRLEKEKSSSNSQPLVYFIKILCEEAFHNKEKQIEEIIGHLEGLQKNII